MSQGVRATKHFQTPLFTRIFRPCHLIPFIPSHHLWKLEAQEHSLTLLQPSNQSWGTTASLSEWHMEHTFPREEMQAPLNGSPTASLGRNGKFSRQHGPCRSSSKENTTQQAAEVHSQHIFHVFQSKPVGYCPNTLPKSSASMESYMWDCLFVGLNFQEHF